jgi:nitrogen-specific signal transduction histidine kinase
MTYLTNIFFSRMIKTQSFMLPMTIIFAIGFPVFIFLYPNTEDLVFNLIGSILALAMVAIYFFVKNQKIKYLFWFIVILYGFPIDFFYGYWVYPDNPIYISGITMMLMSVIIIFRDIWFSIFTVIVGATIAYVIQYEHISFNIMEDLVNNGIIYAFILCMFFAVVLIRRREKDYIEKSIIKTRQYSDIETIERRDIVVETIASIAHEVNQPISSAHNYVNGVLRRIASDTAKDNGLVSQQSDALRKASHEIARAGEMIHSLKRLYEKREQTKVVTDINELIKKIGSFVEDKNSDYKIDFTNNLDMSLKPIFGDALQIEIAILNLIKNSQESVNKDVELKKTIEVITSQECNKKLKVLVVDNGPGVESEMKENIFLPFITSKETGLGLGLSLCYNIVMMHEGEIEYYRKDNKTVFEITLPTIT